MNCATLQSSFARHAARWLEAAGSAWTRSIAAVAAFHPRCAAAVACLTENTQLLREGGKAFYNIEENDESLTRLKKIGETQARGWAYDLFDYWGAAVCAAVVGTLNYWQWSFWQIAGATWAFDCTCTTLTVLTYYKTGLDFTLGTSYRRVAEVLKTKSWLIGQSVSLFFNVKAIIWDGPDQVIYFYKYELINLPRMLITGFFLTAIQATFWSIIYSFGYNSLFKIINI